MLHQLEQHAIGRALLEREEELDKLRERQNPINQLADAMLAEHNEASGEGEGPEPR